MGGGEAEIDTPGNAPLQFTHPFEIRANERTRFVADFAPIRRDQGDRYLLRPVASGTRVLYGDGATIPTRTGPTRKTRTRTARDRSVARRTRREIGLGRHRRASAGAASSTHQPPSAFGHVSERSNARTDVAGRARRSSNARTVHPSFGSARPRERCETREPAVRRAASLVRSCVVDPGIGRIDRVRPIGWELRLSSVRFDRKKQRVIVESSRTAVRRLRGG